MLKTTGATKTSQGVAVLLMALSTGSAAVAQSGPIPSVTAEPAATAATFGDWTLRCQSVALAVVNEPAEPARTCEVVQSMQIEGQSAPIAQVAIGRVGEGEPLRVTVVLPNNVAFPSTVRIAAGPEALATARTGPALELPWRRCQPGACFADATLTEAILAQWRAAPQPGRLLFNEASGRELAIPLSFRGLSQALDALSTG